MSTILRPGQISIKNEVSFLWRRGVALVELVYEPNTGKLRFAIQESGTPVQINDTAGFTWFANGATLKPLVWLQAGAHRGAIGLPSQPIAYESVDVLIEAARGFIHSYFDCDQRFEHVAAAYALMTWIYEAFDALPYLRFLGEPESGKSTGSLVIGAICYRNFGSGGAQTSAPVFRLIEALGGTLLLDEADFRISQIGSDISKILNTGYRKGFPVQRCSEDNSRVEFYDAFGPKIFNGRKPFQDEAVETRCLTYRPITTTREDIPLQLPSRFGTDALDIRNKALSWRFENLEKIAPTNERVPGLGARATQIILPLLAVVSEIKDGVLRAEYRENILAFARESKEERVSAKQDSTEAALIRAYADIIGRCEIPTCQKLADAVGSADEGPVGLTAKEVGRTIRNLGFKTKHGRMGTVASIDAQRLESLKISYGVTERESVTANASQLAECVTGDER